ncbi:N-6 DNA methylase [Geodermatophilus sp. URMC 60]
MSVPVRPPSASALTNQLWTYCHVLRHDGVDYGDYIEQLTYLIFLKIARERGVRLPEGCSWEDIKTIDAEHLSRYQEILSRLEHETGMLGEIFHEARSKLTHSSSFTRLVQVIDEVDWSSLGIDVQAAVFEGLLERAAAEGKKGAGQYFTPRPLIQSIVRCVKPDPRGHASFRIGDPACGTGGFLVAAYEWLLEQERIDRKSITPRIKSQTYAGVELVQRPRRLALMNLHLHGIDPDIILADAIYGPPDRRKCDVILTNPPFGTRGAGERPPRPEFAIATNNKQINFVQHAVATLRDGGRAAIVVPDNVLFGSQATLLFELLTQHCDIHTVLRCPDGTFSPYTEGTKTNVVFLTKGPQTKKTWIYDARTGVPRLNKRTRPLLHDAFHQFEKCFGSDPNGLAERTISDSAEGRWRDFDIDELRAHEYKIASLRWLESEPELPASSADHLAEAARNVESLLQGIRSLREVLDGQRP